MPHEYTIPELERIRELSSFQYSRQSIAIELNVPYKQFAKDVNNRETGVLDAIELGEKDFNKLGVICLACRDSYRSQDDRDSIKTHGICTYCYEHRDGEL